MTKSSTWIRVSIGVSFEVGVWFSSVVVCELEHAFFLGGGGYKELEIHESGREEGDREKKLQTFTGKSRSCFLFGRQFFAVMVESEEVEREIVKFLL